MPKLDTSYLFSALKRFDAAARELIIATNDQASEYIITVQFGRYLQILTAIVCVSPADYKDERINLWPTKCNLLDINGNMFIWTICLILSFSGFIPSADLNWKPNEFTYIVFEIAINRSEDTDRLLELFNFSQKNERRRLDRNRRRVDTIEDKLASEQFHTFYQEMVKKAIKFIFHRSLWLEFGVKFSLQDWIEDWQKMLFHSCSQILGVRVT